jgi:hypothetical protein
MLIRLVWLLSALFIVISFLAYLFTRDARYLRFSWQVARFMLIVALVLGVLYLLERYGLSAWHVLL